mgnify:CR=1 FL=1
MSVPRLLFVPTHKTGLAYAVASLLAEIAARGRVPVRLHHLGALGSAAVWDRWGGSGFIDPGLYGMKAAGDLYVKSMAEAQLSLLSASVGLYDDGPSGSWTPAVVARKLDAPVVLLLDVRGWGRTLEHVLNGVRAAAEEINIAGVIFCGARDGAHVESIRRLVCGPNLPLVGALMDRDALTWDSPAPGVANVPPFGDVTEMVALMEQRLDLDLVEQLAELGYAVIGQCGDGATAVDLCAQLQPDIALLDINMPGSDGLTAAAAIAATGTTAVIMLTAYGQRDLVRDAGMPMVGNPQPWL